MKKAAFLFWILFQCIPASAYAADVVRSPLVQQGDFNFDYKGKSQYDSNPRLDNIQDQDFGFGYGVTENWRTRIETEFTDQHNSGLQYKYIGLANTIALSGKDSFLPTAIFINIVSANKAYISNYVTAGLASQKELGPTTNMINLFLKHEYGNTASGKLSLLYRFQSKYNLYSYLEPGFELFGDTNKQSAFDNQMLKIGPGLFGTIPLGSERINYALSFLLGVTSASPDGTVQWRLSYTFH